MPYQVQWLDGTDTFPIEYKVQVPFKIGAYEDTVECDVVPMKVCHMLLGRSWQFEKGALHDGRSNQYSFKWNDKLLVLIPMTPSQLLAESTSQKSCKMRGKRVTHTYVSESHKPKLSEKIMSATTTATKSEKSDLSVSHTNHISTSSSSLLSILQGTRKEEDDIRDHQHDHLQQSPATDDKFYIRIEQGFDPGDTSSFKRDLNFTASLLSYSHRGRDSFESRTTHLEGGGR